VTLATILDTQPDASIAIIEGDESTTYGELRELVALTRSGLVAAGVMPRDRVAVVCTNTRAAAVGVLAAVSADMVAVLLDPNSPIPELRTQVEAIGAAHVLTGTPIDGDLHDRVSAPAGTTVAGVDHLPEGPEVTASSPNPGDLAVMLFTSGTAGSPKAAMLSHGNLISNQDAIITTDGAGLAPESIVLATIPISHMYGFNISLLSTLRVGGTVVMAAGFHPDTCVELVARHGIDRFAGVPPMWRSLIDSDAPDDAFARVSRIASGASALHPRLWQEFRTVSALNSKRATG